MPEYTGFALFTNDKKASPKAPDYKGDGTLDQAVIDFIVAEARAGRSPKLRIAGWVKQGQRARFISIKIEAPYETQGSSRPAPARQGPAREDPDDDLPF